jgi:hypothetical protein
VLFLKKWMKPHSLQRSACLTPETTGCMQSVCRQIMIQHNDKIVRTPSMRNHRLHPNTTNIATQLLYSYRQLFTRFIRLPG